MADYCVRCHEKMNARISSVLKEHPWDYEWEYGICEGCGQLSDDLVVGLRPSLYKRYKQRRKWIQMNNNSLK